MAGVKDALLLHLKRLKLRHFRTYDDLDLRLLPGVTLLHGPNAAGKTNILEAIFCLGTTKSFRTRSDRELISWNPQEEPVPRFARIEGDAEARNGPVRVEMAIAEQPARGPVEVSTRKQFKLNGRPVRASDVVGEVKVVLFSPDDVDLVTGSPSQRRRFMDLTLCQIDHRYLRLLQEYGRVVVQRNSLLQRLRGRPDPATLLEFWDEKLVATGVQIMSTRKAMLRVLNDFAREAYTDLSGLGEELTIAYVPSLEGAADASEAHLADLFRTRLAQLQTKEIYQGATLVGPHRDDLQFLVNDKDMQSYGSRGQQRSVALSLRLAELRYMTNRTGEQPILLLDEAMAELDEDRRRLLLRLMQSHPQVLVTTANIDAFPEDFRDAATVLRVDAGGIERRPPLHARAS
jgi:DNA replication and repair protein RecF